MFLKRILTPERARFIKFGLVGGSGVVVNEFALWLFQDNLLLGLDPEVRLTLSGIAAIGIAIFTNFVLNDLWTWSDRVKHPGVQAFFVRMAKYYLVASVAGAVQLGVLKLLTEQAGVHYLASNLVGIAAGLVINFFVNNLWTFRSVRRRR